MIALRASELIALAVAAGWAVDRQRGSHIVLTKPGHRSVPVAVHGNTSRELRPDVVRSLLRQLGLPR